MIRVLAVAGLVASFAANAADIQKCADATGAITYQDSPCPRGNAIGTLPRESAQADPAALRQLERDKARLERAADARIAAENQQQAPKVIIVPQAQPNGGVAGQAGVPAYTLTSPVNIDPNTGAVIVPGTNAVVDPNTGTVLSLGTNPGTQSNQPSATAPSGITQLPANSPSSITQVPSTSQISGTSTPLSVTPSPTVNSPPSVMSPPATPRGR